MHCLDKEGVLHEAQAAWIMFTLVQGRLKEDKETYALFLDVQKAYDTVWRDGL